MTVSTLTTQNTYSGDGITSTFAIGFFCLDPSWVTCFISTVSTSAFTVVLNVNQSTTPGGTVTFTTPPPSGIANILIKRLTPATQLTNYTEYDAFPALSHMSALDKLTALTQDLLADVSSTVIPPLVAGLFLSNDGTNLLWAAGGGGGGISIIGAPIAAAPNGALITGVGSDVLQLGIADETNPGILDPAVNPQPIGGIKLFEDGAAYSLVDIRDVKFAGGAVSIADPTNPATVLFDSQPAINAALNFNLSPFPLGGIVQGAYAGAGNYAVSKPTLIPNLASLKGEGQFLTNFFRGPGTPATPAQVQGFSGPMFYVTATSPTSPPAEPFFPLYTTPVIGVTGQAMQYGPVLTNSGFTFPCANLWLHDSWAWWGFFQAGTSDFCLQLWFDLQTIPGFEFITPLIGSLGPYSGNIGTQDSAFAIYIHNQPGYLCVRAVLTTTSGITTIDTPMGVIANGNAYNIELDYQGSFVDLYINGVNQGHVAASGHVVMTSWEGVSIGEIGTEYQTITSINITGAMDSICLSNVHQHTGTGTFVPPTAKYTWGSNTIALINFDQPLVLNEGFIVAQAGLAGPQPAGPNPHYIRVGHGWNFVFNTKITDCTIDCGGSTTAIVNKAGARCLIENLFIISPAFSGHVVCDGPSFYVVDKNVYVYGGYGNGIIHRGTVENCTTQACAIGVQMLGGILMNHNDNPGGNSFIPYVVGPGDPIFGPVTLIGNGNDNEGSFTGQRTALFVFGDLISNLTSQGNVWLGDGNGGKPAAIFSGSPENGFMTFTEDGFYVDSTATCYVSDAAINIPDQKVYLENCRFTPTVAGTVIPISDTPGFAIVKTPTQINNQAGLSISDEQANNLAGTFTILHGYTEVAVYFATPEPDGNYQVYVFYNGFSGSAPAAGSTTLGYVITDPSGAFFTYVQGTDPAGTSQTNWNYLVVRTYGAPLYQAYIPTIPSSITNPLHGLNPKTFYAGATVVQASGHVFKWASDTNFQQVMEAGDGGSGANFWGLALNHAMQPTLEQGSVGGNYYDSFVINHQLYGVANPGVHNIVYGSIEIPGGFRESALFVDGAKIHVTYTSPIVQPTTLYTGKLYDASQQLTVATLRNQRVDTIFSQVYVREQDYGPQAGNNIAAFFGDQMTIGYGATSGGSGGFASQIAENRYGTTYYYLAAYGAQPGPAYITNAAPPGILQEFWVNWGNLHPELTAVCLLAGFNDLLNGVSGATTFAAINQLLNGVPAQGLFVCPEHVSSAPPNVPSWPIYDYQAWAIFVNPSPAGTSTFVINGVTFTAAWTTDQFTTQTNLANTINANGSVNTLITASAQFEADSNQWQCLITAKASGSAGNGITTTTNGSGGSTIYPGGTTQFGEDVTCVIQGVSFIANWDTNASTTASNLLARINASGPTLALVTPTIVSNNIQLVAVTSGTAGDSITTTGNAAGNSGFQAPTLLGGANGAIQNAIGTIVVCTVPPFGQATGYSSAKETQRNACNTLIRAVTGAGVAIADVDVALRDPAAHQNILAAYLAADNTNPNDAGHGVLYTLLSALLP